MNKKFHDIIYEREMKQLQETQKSSSIVPPSDTKFNWVPGPIFSLHDA